MLRVDCANRARGDEDRSGVRLHRPGSCATSSEPAPQSYCILSLGIFIKTPYSLVSIYCASRCPSFLFGHRRRAGVPA